MLIRVVALSMSPVDDMFLSGSLDKTLRLWDLRSPNCQGLMHLTSRPVAAFDPEGLIFAAGVNSESVKLYDLRSFDKVFIVQLKFSIFVYIHGLFHFKGPFASFRLNTEKTCEWTGLKFSPDGKTILLSTNSSIIRLVDAFHGNPTHTLTVCSLLVFEKKHGFILFLYFIRVILTIRKFHLKRHSVPIPSLFSAVQRTDEFTFGMLNRVIRQQNKMKDVKIQ